MKVFAWVSIIAGPLIVIFSETIVFPGLEILLGIETIVGAKNVYYEDGGYVFTNPEAMMIWVLSVAACGIGVLVIGVIILLISNKHTKPNNNSTE